MRDHGPEEALRFAARVVSDPAVAVGRWRALTGGKAVGCTPPIPVPEILHAAGLLPVPWVAPETPDALRSRLDGWVVARAGPVSRERGEGRSRFEFPTARPADPASALDVLESLAEWAGALSGRPVTEGNLWKSIRAYRERDALLLLLGSPGSGGGGFPDAGERRDLARAGDFLPPEAHSLLLERALGVSDPATPGSFEEEREDPVLRLARRWIAGSGGETPFPPPGRGMVPDTTIPPR